MKGKGRPWPCQALAHWRLRGNGTSKTRKACGHDALLPHSTGYMTLLALSQTNSFLSAAFSASIRPNEHTLAFPRSTNECLVLRPFPPQKIVSDHTNFTYGLVFSATYSSSSLCSRHAAGRVWGNAKSKHRNIIPGEAQDSIRCRSPLGGGWGASLRLTTMLRSHSTSTISKDPLGIRVLEGGWHAALR